MSSWWKRIVGGTRDESLSPALARLGPRLEAAILAPDREPSRTQLLAHYALAMEVHAALRDAPARLVALDEEVNLDIGAWVEELPCELARVGLTEEAAELALAWSQIVYPDIFLGDRGVILAEAGFEAKARSQVRENLERFPGDVWIAIKAGDAFLGLKDEREAEVVLRRALAMAGEKHDREGALQRLVPLLEKSGRAVEAAALKGVAPAKAKAGRNAPCPCGSGKKYKMCCLPKEEPAPTFQDVKKHVDATWQVKESGSLPVQDCYVNPDWQEAGIARIVVLRREENGRFIAGVYLVDTWCLGMKNAFCNADLPVERIEGDLLRRCYFDRPPAIIGLNTAKEIIFGAIAYAGELGFVPHPDFELASRVLGAEPWEPNHQYRFGGPNGKPLYVAGPDDDADAIIRRLREKLGPSGFEFIAPLSL